MRKYTFIAAIIAIMSVMYSCAQCEQFKVYYVPLEANFFGPPTPEVIERIGTEIQLSSCKLEELYDICEKSQLGMHRDNEFMMIRIKIIRVKDGKTLYISQNKQILSDNGRLYNIDTKLVERALEDITSHISIKDKEWRPKLGMYTTNP